MGEYYIHQKLPFVLRFGRDDEYGIAARRAMLTFADSIEHVDPDHAREIRTWVDDVRRKLMEKRYSKVAI